jgi:hypothetical protein
MMPPPSDDYPDAPNGRDTLAEAKKYQGREMDNENEYPDAPQGRRTLKEGKKYEEFVRKLINPWGITMWHHEDKLLQWKVGENRQGCEIKLDNRCTDTGRLSIEIAEKTLRTKEWVASGIMRQDNSWLYIQGNYQIVFVFSKSWLIRYYEQKVTPADTEEHNGTVRKFYLPLQVAKMCAALVLDGEGKRIDSFIDLFQTTKGRSLG